MNDIIIRGIMIIDSEEGLALSLLWVIRLIKIQEDSEKITGVYNYLFLSFVFMYIDCNFLFRYSELQEVICIVISIVACSISLLRLPNNIVCF